MGTSEDIGGPTTPEGEIAKRIAARGKISFAEFMEFALYHPRGGYYTGPSAFGARGDYFTSPAAHPAFGALIALQLQRIWEVLARPSPFFAVEMGAGGGLLARDVVDYAAGLPGDFGPSLRYVALERYAGDQEGATTAARIIAAGVPLKGVVGCFISNELLDSFPVHRFQVDGGAVREIFVTRDDDGRLIEALGQPSPSLERGLDGLGLSLPEGFRGEFSPNIRPWLMEVSDALRQGFVLTVDYGYPAGELYSAERSEGTLQTYYRHTRGGSPYQRVGRQDITAHVDFSLVASEGESLGLRTTALLTQTSFLRQLGFDDMLERLRAMPLGQRQRSANVMAMRELVKPEGLGGFRVLVQERGTGVTDPSELVPRGLSSEGLQVPLLGPDHVPLMEGRYPHLAWEPEGLWPPDTSS